MAKNRNKKKKSDKASMDTSEDALIDFNTAMGTSESADASNSVTRKIKGLQMKRSKNMRRKKAMAKAISRIEKTDEKVIKYENKKMRVKSAKSLYD